MSEHGHAAALAFNCLPDEIAKTIIHQAYENNQRDNWVECQPYFTRVLLEGLHAHQRRDLALEIIEERWGKRFRDRGLDSCPEEWTANGSFRNGNWTGFVRTISHAWSACVSEFLQRRLSGIKILEPGGKKISVDPYDADFSYELRIPLQHGWVTVKHLPGKQAQVHADKEIEIQTL